MALSEEGRALLQLLVGRRKDYGQIAVLLGIQPPDVRSRAEEAIGELDGVGGPIGQPATDHLLGQADPIDRAEAVRILVGDPDLASRFADARDQLALLFPGSALPSAPISAVTEKSPRRAPGRRSFRNLPLRKPPAGMSEEDFDGNKDDEIDGRNRTILAALIAAVGLAAVIGVVILLGDGGAEKEANQDLTMPTSASLESPDGGGASGEIEIGTLGDSFAARIAFDGLEKSGPRDGYALWLEGPAGSFPFRGARVGRTGRINGQFPLPLDAICLIAGDLFTEFKVSKVSTGAAQKLLREAESVDPRQPKLPEYIGRTVLQGPIAMPPDIQEQLTKFCGELNARAG